MNIARDMQPRYSAMWWRLVLVNLTAFGVGLQTAATSSFAVGFLLPTVAVVVPSACALVWTGCFWLRAVVEAARRAGVRRIVMVSFLRARPECGSPYHESKWAAEEIVRRSGIDHTILKCGMIYGSGDHMVDHVTKAVRTFPIFATVGYSERMVRPIAVDDAVDVLVAALEGRVADPTVAVMGPERLELGAAVRRIAEVARRRPVYVRAPIWSIRALAQVTEWAMVTPLVAKAQAFMLAEGVDEAAPPTPELPQDLRPTRMFTRERIRAAMPDGRFGRDDLRALRRRR